MIDFILISIFNLIDVIATLYLYNTGLFIELNPFMAFLLENPIIFAIIKIGIMTLLLLRLWRERQDKYAKIALRIGEIMYGAIAIYYCFIWIWFSNLTI